MISMGNAISSATALGDTKDAIMFSAAQDALGNAGTRAKYVGSGKDWSGTYIDTQLMLEQGVTPEFMKSYFNKVDNLYGDDHTGKIEELKRDFNLNYTGATQLYEMSTRKGEIDKSEIDKILSNKDYQDKETQMLDAVNKIKDSKVLAGEGVFNVELTGLEAIAQTTQDIYKWLTRGENQFTETGLYDTNNINAGKLNDQFKDLKGADYTRAMKILDMANGFSPEMKEQIQKTVQTGDVHEWMSIMEMVENEYMKGDKGDVPSLLENIKRIQGVASVDKLKQRSKEGDFALDFYNPDATAAFEKRIDEYALKYERVYDENTKTYKWQASTEGNQKITDGERMDVYVALMKHLAPAGKLMADAFIALLNGQDIPLNVTEPGH